MSWFVLINSFFQRILSFQIVKLIMRCRLFLEDLSLLRERLFVMLKSENSHFGLVMKKLFSMCVSPCGNQIAMMCTFLWSNSADRRKQVAAAHQPILCHKRVGTFWDSEVRPQVKLCGQHFTFAAAIQICVAGKSKYAAARKLCGSQIWFPISML